MGRKRENRKRENSSFPAPPIDPTENVKELVAARDQRQDDLRDAETRRVNELGAQRDKYEDKLAKKEAERLNAIRDIDVKAVFTASEKQEAAARVLAAAVTASAEALRALVASTAQAAAEGQTRISEGQTRILEGITGRLTILEASRYEIKGQAGGTQDAAELARSKQRDKWGWFIAVAMALIAIAAIVVPYIR